MRNSAFIMLFCLGCGSASAWDGTVVTQGRIPDGCRDTPEVPCVQMWSTMTAAERAKLWPYLDEVARAMHWRSMTSSERKAMRSLLSEADRDRLRRRYSSVKTDEHGSDAKARVKLGNLCNEDRSLMRRQITEFHVELVGSRGRGRSHFAGGQDEAERTAP